MRTAAQSGRCRPCRRRRWRASFRCLASCTRRAARLTGLRPLLRAETEADKCVAYFLQTEDGIPPLQVRQLFEVGEGGYVGARPVFATPVLFHSATPVPVVGLTPELEVMVRHATLWDHCTPLCCLPACP